MIQRFKISDIIIGILFTLFFISIGVIFVINFRPLYYLDMEHLHISDRSGFSNKVILENYNALIDYNSPFFKGDLRLPSLLSSKNGIRHFKEVKDIISFFYIICPLNLFILFLVILYKKKKKDYRYLLVSSITALVLPVLLTVCIWINFDAFFILFHKIFFRNDAWLFDPSTDPIINILPEAFFMHCAFVIIVFILLGSLILFFINKWIHSSKSHRFIREN